MEQLAPGHRRIAVLAFGPHATRIASEASRLRGTVHPATIDNLVSGAVETDLIVLVAEAREECAGLDRVNAYARAENIALLALVLDATEASAASPAAVALRPVADTLVLTTDDDLLAVMAHWLERTA